MPIANSVAELERCVNELGFVGCNLNPDPSGGHWTSMPLTDPSWYPFYEKMVELDVPAMIHVSSSCNPNFHATGAHYMNADTTAFMQFIQGDLFRDFPDLRFIIPHGGGAVPYHWGRYRGLADMLKRPPLPQHVMKNVYFDTCVYHQPGIDLLFRVIEIDNILFGSEMVARCAASTRRPAIFRRHQTLSGRAGHSDEDRRKVFELNARRVYPRLDAALKAQGKTTARPPSRRTGLAGLASQPVQAAFAPPRGRGGRPLPRLRPGDGFRSRPNANTRPAMPRRTSCGRCATIWVFPQRHRPGHLPRRRQPRLVDALEHSTGSPAASPRCAPSGDDALQALTRPACAACGSTSSSAWSMPPKAPLMEIARRIAPLGWHTVIYFEAADLRRTSTSSPPCRRRWSSTIWAGPTFQAGGRTGIRPVRDLHGGQPELLVQGHLPRAAVGGRPPLRRRGPLRPAPGGTVSRPGSVGTDWRIPT